MATLVRGVGGKLLRGPGGKLARGLECCCDFIICCDSELPRVIWIMLRGVETAPGVFLCPQYHCHIFPITYDEDLVPEGDCHDTARPGGWEGYYTFSWGEVLRIQLACGTCQPSPKDLHMNIISDCWTDDGEGGPGIDMGEGFSCSLTQSVTIVGLDATCGSCPGSGFVSFTVNPYITEPDDCSDGCFDLGENIVGAINNKQGDATGLEAEIAFEKIGDVWFGVFSQPCTLSEVAMTLACEDEEWTLTGHANFPLTLTRLLYADEDGLHVAFYVEFDDGVGCEGSFTIRFSVVV